MWTLILALSALLLIAALLKRAKMLLRQAYIDGHREGYCQGIHDYINKKEYDGFPRK